MRVYMCIYIYIACLPIARQRNMNWCITQIVYKWGEKSKSTVTDVYCRHISFLSTFFMQLLYFPVFFVILITAEKKA